MRNVLALLLSTLLTLSVSAQSVGPDVIVGSISDVGNYGTDGSGIYAYSLGTTSCNIGTAPVQWVANTNAHPVIGQHIFRLKPVAGQPYSRFEQIGMSWLKHGFTALAGSLCNTCQNPGTGSLLGVGCSDPYGASLNGGQGNGPRSDVNAATGYFPYPSTSFPSAAPTIGRRIQCAAADVNPALNAGATYWGDCQYVTADDALAGNKNNNASYRLMTFAASTFTGALSGPTVQQQPAIMAWAAADASVQITNVDFPNDGRFIIAKRITALGGGTWHYEFAIHNLNSDRSGRGFTVDFPAGTVVSNPGFKDINYHSGEIWSGTDWTVTNNGASINWATQLFSVNPNANAHRWGTTYNFWFDATASVETSKTIEPFKPEPCPADPVITPPNGYVLNTNAAFDNPAPVTPIPGPTGDDSTMAGVPIGFTFTYYGVNYTSLNLCTNGFVSFTSNSNAYQNVCIPNASAPNAMIAGLWDDLITPPGTVTYETQGSAPNRRFIASWNAVGHFGATGTLESFKIILDETTNLITTTIVSSMGGGASATRGIENQAGTQGTSASCNVAGSALAGTSQTYTVTNAVVPSAILTVTGSTGPGGALTWAVNSNAHVAPVVLVASLDPGPLNLGPLGVINVGLTPGLYAVIADGAGALQPANPADVTDSYCGDLSVVVPLPGGLPPGLTIYNQGVVISTTSIPVPPNGQFHITTAVTINT